MRLLSVCALLAGSAAVAAPVPKHLMPKSDAGVWRKLDSGLEVLDAKPGSGEPAKPGATVTVHYTGWLDDGKMTKFDTTRDRGQPMTFALAQVIKGWQEGVPGMKPGGVRRLRIPAALAYGERGLGPIPPNATLVFEIELVEAK